MWLSSLRTLSAAANSDSDLREVLDLVAETARSLLGFDFCGVLTPGHDQRSLVITGWSGLSEDYVNQVNADRPVALDGTAPSSRAFHSGAPIAIRDIATESRFSPWGGVAREQGYRAIIAVPLVAGGQVLGTLNGYYAPVHTFTSHEVERLALLANHAAIALTSAQRLDQLHRLTESLLAQRDLLARSEQIHERFLAAALRSGGLDEIARILADLITRSVLVEDVRGGVLTSAGECSTLPDAGRRAEVRIGDTAGSTPHQVVVDGEPCWVSTVRLADEVVARIWFPDTAEPLDPIGERAVEHASIVVALELLRLRTGVEVEHRLRGELMADLLGSRDVIEDQVIRRGEMLGHDFTRPHVVIVGAIVGPSDRMTARGSQRALAAVAEVVRSYQPRPLVAMYRGTIVVLWPTGVVPGGADTETGADDEGTHAAHLVRKALTGRRQDIEATVAVHRGHHDNYAHVYRTARGALHIAQHTGHSDSVVTLGDLGITGLLLQLDDPTQLLAFADRTLLPLLEYDRKHDTDLVRTLRAYLDSRLNRPDTAQALHIHVNTVKQRLRRIEQLTGADFGDAGTVVQFSTALTLRDVASLAT